MKLIVTGGEGYLGRTIIGLNKKEFSIYSLGRSNSNTIVQDLSNEKFIELPKVDGVVHCAGKAHSVPKTEKEKQVFYTVNLQGTKNLCRALEEQNNIPRFFVFISTVAVYGQETGEMIDESHELKGISPYADSKIQAEKFLIIWAKENNVNLSILRLPLIVGLNPPGNLGKMINGISKGRYLRIGRANARKSMVLSEDVARLIPRLADTQGIYNLTDRYHPSFKEIEQLIAEKLSKKEPMAIPLFIAKMLGRIGDILGSISPINSNTISKIINPMTFDDSKAKKELNWNPTPVLKSNWL